jgi:glucokinase
MGSDFYLGIDIGGTKTLVAVFDHAGQIVFEQKIKTTNDYAQFLAELGKVIETVTQKYTVKAACCAITAVEFDRERGIGRTFGNLDWVDAPIKDDLGKLLGNVPVYVENDAKLAALFEFNIIGEFKKILYITIGTGVGIALVVDGVIDTQVGDAGGRGFMLEYDGQQKAWDDIASGRFIFEHYGKKASEITDPSIWQDYVKPLAKGLEILIGLMEPEAVVIGGGVGAHLEKFDGFLKEELQKYRIAKLKLPPIIKAQRSEEAVIYGCYDYIKQNA